VSLELGPRLELQYVLHALLARRVKQQARLTHPHASDALLEHMLVLDLPRVLIVAQEIMP